MTLRSGVIGAVVGLLALTLVLMVADARTGDWPGWDEGWAIILFPLGIPLAAAGGLRLAGGASVRRVALVTAAVWCWGALVFLAWLVAG